MKPCTIKVSCESSMAQLARRSWPHAIEIRLVNKLHLFTRWLVGDLR